MQKCTKRKKYYERAQQTVSSYDELNKKCLQHNVIDEKIDSLCNIFSNTRMTIKVNLFFNE